LSRAAIEAAAQAKAAREETEEIRDSERGLRMSNLGARIREQQAAR